MATTQGSVTVHVLLIEKQDGWIAQCLDFDIVAQAETLDDLTRELERVLVSHVAVSLELGREPFAGLKAAPKKYWDAYERTRWRIEHDDEFAQLEGVASMPLLPKLKVTNARELEVA